MMYTKALRPAAVVVWAGRGWAGLPAGSPLLQHEEEAPPALRAVWQPKAEGRAAAAAMGPTGSKGTGVPLGERGGRFLPVEEEPGCALQQREQGEASSSPLHALWRLHQVKHHDHPTHREQKEP